MYATHIFDGLDDWPTHVHYLNDKGFTGWQGKLEDLELAQEMRRRGETSPLLRVAEHWLRAELNAKAQRGEMEAASGPAAQALLDPNQQPTALGGGFTNGRMAAYDFVGNV